LPFVFKTSLDIPFMNDFFNFQEIYRIVHKYFIHFVVVGVIAVLLSALFSSPYFITPRFKSTARIYPVNIAVTSNESESEQMLEIINSNDIKFKMFDAFRLDEVYNIRKDNPHYLTYMLGEYNRFVSVNKTEFETVEISVLDKEPARAALMCDSIIHFYNLKVREMHALKNWEMVKILSDNMKRRIAERDSLVEVLRTQRRNFHLLDFTHQAREVTRGYMNALTEGGISNQGEREIRQLYDNLAEKGTDNFITQTLLEQTMGTLDSLKKNYEVHLSEAKKEISYCFVVESPVPSDKKAYPVRWVIVAVATFSTLFLALLIITLLDRRKKN